jgi:hypothetical protein
VSQLYRCDGCRAEAEHPGVSFYDEEMYLPDGWKTGPAGDFCPAHPMRIVDGEYMYALLFRDEDEEHSDFGSVAGYDEEASMYEFVWYDDASGKEDSIMLPLGDLRPTSSTRWVPIR